MTSDKAPALSVAIAATRASGQLGQENHVFHIPAHKNAAHPAGQYREPHPSRQIDEDSASYPTAPRERHPGVCDASSETSYGTCYGRILRARIERRAPGSIDNSED